MNHTTHSPLGSSGSTEQDTSAPACRHRRHLRHGSADPRPAVTTQGATRRWDGEHWDAPRLRDSRHHITTSSPRRAPRNVSPSSSSLQHSCGSPSCTCPDDHYLIVIADDPLVVSDAIFPIAIILWRSRGLDLKGPSTNLWDYKHARAHGGGRKRRRGATEDVYAPATVSLSSRGPGTALFKNSPSERSSRRLEYLRVPDEKIDRPEAACLKIIAAMFRRGEVTDEPPTHWHIFVHVKKLWLQGGLYPDSYTRHGTIFHGGTSDNIVNLASVKYQKRKRTVGVDGRPVMNNRALYEKVLATQEGQMLPNKKSHFTLKLQKTLLHLASKRCRYRQPRFRLDWSNSKTFELNSKLLFCLDREDPDGDSRSDIEC
ncbi:hypothetical protein ALC62_15111 [Cyphomyrmex costatus]|uniref:Uncharacterized protein n=1 Tax=Cyphomyrmex costatus TaxID=456900 RepID=A0A151I823_9HYME|nr:hypothetical protein ALC62_15111 [Cyphomyrmex costatus]